MRHLLRILIALVTLAVSGPAAGGDSFSPPREDAGPACDAAATKEDLIASAREMFVAGNHTLAEMLYQCVLSRDPDDIAAILELSVVYEAAGKLQSATELVSKAAALRPFDQEIIDRKRELEVKLAEALEADANSLIARGAHGAAIPKLTMLLQERPDDPELHYKKALCYLKLGDAVGALLEIDKAAGIRKDIRYSVLRAKAVDLGKTQDVGALVQEAQRLSASDSADDRERTLALLSQILARDPEHEWARSRFMLLSNGGGLAAPDARPEINGRSRIALLATSAARKAAGFVTGVLKPSESQTRWLVAALIVLVLFGSPLTSTILRGVEPQHRLSGRLADFNLQEILSLIHSQGKSGVLRVRTGRERARVFFVDGEIHHCESGKTEGRDAIRSLLAPAREGHFVLTELPRSFKRTMDAPFSLVLMDIGDRSFLEPKAPAAPRLQASKKSRMKSLLEDKK